MVLVTQHLSLRRHRHGKIIPLFAVLLPVLCGMVGLVLDTGLLLAAHRQAQNAADSGAMAAAFRLWRDGPSATDAASSDATTFVKTHNGLANATVATNTSYTGYANRPNCVEVVVSNTVQTAFLQALGISGSTVSARAVAGVVPLDWIHISSRDNGLIALNPAASPGLLVGDGSSLNVSGSVVVNAAGGGYDQYGQSISVSTPALQTNGSGSLSAIYVQSNGGASTPANLSDGSGSMPLVTSAKTISDPLNSLPNTPWPWNDSTIASWTTRQAPLNISSTQTLSPGIYQDIKINSGANVTFQPGMYILSPQAANQGLTISGNPTVTGNGVMFYFTGSNYLDYSGIPGYYDSQDGKVDINTATQTLPSPPDPNFSSLYWAGLTINVSSANINLTGLNDSTSPFNNVLFFQRRRIQQSQNIPFSMQESSSTLNVKGVAYAKWNLAQLGAGTYNTQLVVGAVKINDSSAVTISPPSSGTASWKKFGSIANSSAQSVFLLE